MTIADIVKKRKARWEERCDIEYDRRLCDAAAELIVENADLCAEIRKKPYLLIEAIFTVVNKDKDTVPFFLNDVQKDFLSKFEEYETEKPYFILKGRQQGFTTLITAMQLSFAITQKNFAGFTLADRADNTAAIFNDKARVVLERLPYNFKPTEKFNSKNELFFSKLNSSWRCATATDQVGRSRTLSFIHYSEIATYSCSLANLQKAIGEAATGEAIRIYETTANGFNEAKDLWDSTSCINLFYEWWKTPEYRCTDYGYIDRADEWLSERIKVLREYGLDKEQIAWYARKYDAYIDKTAIRQEYPCSPQEAFISSGYCMFDKEALSNQISRALMMKPYKCGYFTYKTVSTPFTDSEGNIVDYSWSLEDIEFVDSRDGFITLHSDVEKRCDREGNVIARKPYAIGADSSGTGTDYYAAKVIDNITGRTVATLHKQRMEDECFGEQILCLAKYYNDALISIESNYTLVPIKTIVQKYGYTNLYMREKWNGTTDMPITKYGFETTRQTKRIIIEELTSLMRSHPELEVDVNTLNEMTCFVKKDDGKMEAIDGKHDDLVISLAIAHYCSTQGEHKWIEDSSSLRDSFIAENFNSKEFSAYSNEVYMNWEDF